MPVRGYQNKILIDHIDLSGHTNAVQIECPVGVLEYQVLQNNGVLKLPSYPTPMITQNGYVSGATADEIHDALDDRLAADNDVTVGVILGTALAQPVAYVLTESFNGQLRIDAPVANLITINGQWGSGTDRLHRGFQCFYGTISATGAQTGIDLAVAGSTGGRAFLFVQAKTGTITSATIKVQSDSASNFATASDEGTFTFSGLGVVSLDLSGAIGRYVRLNVTSLGGGNRLHRAGCCLRKRGHVLAGEVEGAIEVIGYRKRVISASSGLFRVI